MIILPGSNSSELAGRISQELDVELAGIESKKFPDGENYVRIIPDVKDKKCTVIQSTPSNDALVELLLILDLLEDLEASEIDTVIPYLGYSRQDKRFKKGESLSAKTILGLISDKSDSIITVNCHFLKAERVFDFDRTKVLDIDAFPELVNYFKDKVDNPVLLAPDKGSLDLVKNVARTIGCEFDYLKKERLSGEEVKTEAKELNVEGKDVIILDDIISTGNTIINAVELVRGQGAKSVSAGCVHGVFSKGMEKLKAVTDDLVSTDTIQTEASKVSVAKLIASELG